MQKGNKKGCYIIIIFITINKDMFKNKTFGGHLKTLRKHKKLTQSELAELSGLKLNHISKLERNEVEPKLSTLIKLKKALKISSNRLMNEEDKSPEGILISSFEEISRLPEEDKNLINRVIGFVITNNRMERITNSNTPLFEMGKIAIEKIKAKNKK
jgi:transcriptional regulator with XRE-family HTH domain